MKALAFRVQCGLDQHWYVSHYGSKVHAFATREGAEAFAKRWAMANQPSIVHVVIDGEITKEWKFGEETPGIKCIRDQG